MELPRQHGRIRIQKLEQASPTKVRRLASGARFRPIRAVCTGGGSRPAATASSRWASRRSLVRRHFQSRGSRRTKPLLPSRRCSKRAPRPIGFRARCWLRRNGKTLFSGAYGLADREKKIPNRLDTRFRIGSMNKMFTAVSVLQLVEAGKIKLTDPLGKYITDYPNREIATKVTIHQLLTHTGGTGDIFGPEFDSHRLQLRTLNDYVALYGKRGPGFAARQPLGVQQLRHAVGRSGDRASDPPELLRLRARTRIQACRHDFERIAAGRSGSCRAFCRLHAVGFRRVDAEHGHASLSRDIGRGRLLDRGGPERFATALLSHKLLNASSTELLITGKVETGRGPGKYAYGFEDERDKNGNGYVGHGGGAPGMNGDLRIYPKSGYIVAVLANLDPPAAQRISGFLDFAVAAVMFIIRFFGFKILSILELAGTADGRR